MADSSTPRRDIDRVASGLAACLPALHRALDRQVAARYPHPKPPEAQLALLRYVAQHEGATVREAAEALLMKPNNVSALVSQLTEQGDLERRRDSADKRVAHLHVTAVARERLTEVRELETALIRQALTPLTEGQQGALGSALDALDALTRHLRPTR
ncbi:MarR family winged helix-turn-helix transcriptional regulator [Streptomyces olivaceus]|uniref:MarR family winged helix-turn-helix transcriptional regulator n=1 Tax=Streptomyces TaxID=1883 RepID=UPI000878AA8D|nr:MULTISPECIES: MarR family winged helix-turn-helix transcriptional regulator [Streptomyces]AOW85801.1 MarR family transcriptional regulator [Streptomyces olivaceus]MBZ6203761.1 MarR family winged helix-turn-helix transcriptional regulator [Streptomyces olivaceus]MBZ6209042.1 MarR family winged helix-turn-helix transcriptional regulator [Streptomyces olivaceus]QIP69191.1 MarR family transcriptional regulator [Streptomyces sp. VN1]